MRAAARIGLLFAFALAGLSAWHVFDARAPNPNDVPAARLQPQLLADAEQTAAFVAAFPLSEYIVAEVEGQGRFYLDNIDDYIKRKLRKGIVWEPYLVNLMPRHVVPGSTVIDAGAHIGVHTVTLARAAGGKGRVYAFEPQRKLHRELVHNMRLNRLDNVVPLRFAVGDRHGLVEMSPAGAGNEGGTGVGAGGDKAELRTIDSFGFKNVSFMKLDVEGFEDKVLDGAAQTIREQRPVLLVEIQGGSDYDKARPEVRLAIEQTQAKLKAMGYAVKRVSMHDYLATPEPRPGS